MSESNSFRWMPTTGGVLNIVSGAIGILSCVSVFIIAIVLKGVAIGAGESVFYELWNLFGNIFLATAFIILIPCIISIIGGIFAIRRRGWGWALAASICSIVITTVLGIVATVFIVMSKKDFN